MNEVPFLVAVAGRTTWSLSAYDCYGSIIATVLLEQRLNEFHMKLIV